MFDDAALIFQEIAPEDNSRNEVLGTATQIEIMSSYCCLQTIPPFARRVCPLTQAPSGPTRNETTPAMSSGRPSRSSGASFVEKRGDFRRNGNIRLYGHSPPARGPDFLDDIFGVSGVASVVDDNSETVRSEAFGDGGANST
jgi:hypothetical protein